MKSPHVPALHPALLLPGMEVGSWRVVAWAGQGGNGTVYRAVRIGQEQAGPVALKLALQPGDPRLEREVMVLSRLEHPSVPRLLDSGEWQSYGGTRHPFLVMQWIDGVPLYEWALQHAPSAAQVLRLLAQLARALQALHAQEAIHRDVKGGNILVTRTDSRAVLTDFGSSTYEGAAPITPPAVVPGTPVYLSPEAALIELRALHDRNVRYTAGSADDLYSLGVTACRLVTGEYPDFGKPSQDEHRNWRVESVVPPPALLDDARVSPPLRTLILRMLSVRPEERGTATELAELLEQAAERLAPVSAPPSPAEEPLQPSTPSQENAPTAKLSYRSPDTTEVHVQAHEEPIGARGTDRRFRPRAHMRAWWLGLTTAAAGLALATWALRGMTRQSVESPSFARREAAEKERADAGTSGLGDAASIASEEEVPIASGPEAMSQDTLPEPVPGQVRSDSKGRCPDKQLVALNGACWLKAAWELEACTGGRGQMFK
ncbi:MAG: serine/threonine-protein kinase, partial [Hyalangium sp.]|uniref:serine/threonine-protein kinase n=1 Tax=Hyalangium sp. TaxID=2028555 RepID=UPI003899E917